MDHRHVRHADDAGDRCDVAAEIEAELVVERLIDQIRRRDEEERVAVRRARTTAAVPILPPPPGRLSITNGWPSRSDATDPRGARKCLWCHRRRSGRSSAPAASDRLAPERRARSSAARQRLRPDAEVPAGSFISTSCSLHIIRSPRRRARAAMRARRGRVPCRLEVDHQFVLGRRLHRQVGWLLALEDAVHVAGAAAILVNDVGSIGDQAAGRREVANRVDRGSRCRAASVAITSRWRCADEGGPTMISPSLGARRRRCRARSPRHHAHRSGRARRRTRAPRSGSRQSRPRRPARRHRATPPPALRAARIP